MKIRIGRQALQEELFKVQGVVSQRSTLAILSNVLLVADADRLTLHATDLDTSISTSCDAEVLESGRVTLQARALFDLIKKMDCENLELETEDNHWAQLIDYEAPRKKKYRMVGTHPDDFPGMLDTSSAQLFPIGTDRLLDMIEKTLFSVSTDDARANLTGAFFRVMDTGNFLMVSTDGHRLSKIEATPDEFDPGADIPSALRTGIIIPRKGLSELKRTVNTKSEEELFFGLVENSIVFKQGPMALSVRLIEGAFPDFTQVLPRESDNKAVIHKDTFVHALNVVSLFASPKTHNVRLSLSDEGLELYASDPDKGEGSELIAVEYDGPAVKAGYNYRYMIDVLSAVDGDTVTLEIIDTLSPTLIRDVEREEMLFIVMPMRL